MQRLSTCTSAILFCTALFAFEALGQIPTADQQIAAAISPAPAALQDGAKVLGYAADSALVTLREGTNDLVCLADAPGDERFHVACYHASLEPFMARGRALRAENKSRDEIESLREEEIKTGRLEIPSHPAALYSLTGEPGSFDAASGTVSGASPLYVIYIPYATAETTGLPASAPAGQPWIMAPGKPWAHIMLIPQKPDAAE